MAENEAITPTADAGAAELQHNPEVVTDWRDTLPEELRSDPALKDFKDVGTLAKSFRDTKQMIGNMVRIPGEDASQDDLLSFRQRMMERDPSLMVKPDPSDEEGMALVYKALGRPDEPSQYTAPEGVDEQQFGDITRLAHEAGVGDKQLQHVLGGIVARDKAAYETREAERSRDIAVLKGEWGEAFEQKNERAAKLAKATGAPEELVNAVSNNQVGAQTLRWLDKLASSIGAEGNPLSADIGSVTTESRDEIEAQRDELTRKLITDDSISHTERERLQQKLIKLNERLVA